MLTLPPVVSLSASLPPAGGASPLSGRLVAFTTPANYSPRLARLLSLRGAAPLPIPSISVSLNPAVLLRLLLSQPLHLFSAIAFTSRAGISSLSLALDHLHPSPPLSPSGPTFTLAALGSDAHLIHETRLLSKLCVDPTCIRVLVPDVASPAAMISSLGLPSGPHRRILCPVPSVFGLTEPPVVPDFIRDLERAGWAPVRAPAYETRWAGAQCAEALVGLEGELDAILFTSTAEVEGLLKGLAEFGWDWGTVKRRWPDVVVGAHGPVTAGGVQGYGVDVDVVGERFGSFDGVLDALELRLRSSSSS